MIDFASNKDKQTTIAILTVLETNGITDFRARKYIEKTMGAGRMVPRVGRIEKQKTRRRPQSEGQKPVKKCPKCGAYMRQELKVNEVVWNCFNTPSHKGCSYSEYIGEA